MKRSEINFQIDKAKHLFAQAGFYLPPFAFWSPEEWQHKGDEVQEIRDNGLGWDVTDYGLADFLQTGLLLFTLRNGNCHSKERYQKGYAEKIMLVQEGQVTPMHFHWQKREDIINRGGGNLMLELYLSGEDNRLSDAPFRIAIDGRRHACTPGEQVTLKPGESICLEPFIFHTFSAQKGTGYVIVGEVSDVNDDERDNCFLETIGRFPDIVEDERPLHLLCTEYPPSHPDH